MPKKSSIIPAVIALWLASIACGQSVTVPTVDPNAASTAIAETIAALQAQATPTQPPAQPSQPSQPSLTPEAPATDTPVGLILPPFTDTPAGPTVTVSVDTFCRLGPGKEYEKAGILLVGERTEVLGRDAFGLFWYVRNPDIGPEFCWISAQYATVDGNVLSIFAQPPPANLGSDVEVSYLGMGKCKDKWWSDLRIRNQSNATFKSISLVISDGGTNTVRSMTLDVFPFTDGCAAPTSVNTLSPDTSVRISTPEFTYNLAGAEISVAITICTDVGMRGTCISKTLSYSP